MKYLLYGANGYTADLIIKESLKQNLTPILAGRNKEKIEQLGREYGLSTAVFDLEDLSKMKTALAKVDLCFNAAGPYQFTATPLVEACIETKTHYLDITGEIDVFESIKLKDKTAKEAGIMLMPGVGFDVVPSDCVANFLKEKMPDATFLELAFTSRGSGMSHGTAATAISQLGKQGKIRSEGEITDVRIAHKSKTIQFGPIKRTVATIPWGDISTAYTSTGIPNIEVYTSMPVSAIRMMKFQVLFNPLLRLNIVKRMAKRYVDRKITGPSPSQNEAGSGFVLGTVNNGKSSVTALLSCPELYYLTALTSVNIIQKIFDNNLKPGYQTPAGCYGWALIEEIEGCELTQI